MLKLETDSVGKLACESSKKWAKCLGCPSFDFGLAHTGSTDLCGHFKNGCADGRSSLYLPLSMTPSAFQIHSNNFFKNSNISSLSLSYINTYTTHVYGHVIFQHCLYLSFITHRKILLGWHWLVEAH